MQKRCAIISAWADISANEDWIIFFFWNSLYVVKAFVRHSNCLFD